ncbi:MAG: type II toxin-antitoxin system HicB family antitoxin [Candidatus Hydrogenedentes bacterium]|jgi:predicted RNase H-like HicB family nuclease|nr:type II toxin-antitoxin system HicB family antitoxin [Candidatus Hydrogenedentota bacterium]
MKTYAYTVHIESAEEGGFVVTVSAFPGCVTQGKSYEEALAMAQEAIEGFLEALVEIGQPISEEPITIPVDTVIQVTSPGGV